MTSKIELGQICYRKIWPQELYFYVSDRQLWLIRDEKGAIRNELHVSYQPNSDLDIPVQSKV